MEADPVFALLERLIDARVAFIVVGGAAAVLQGAPVTTRDLDIVPRRDPENIDRLHQLLLDLHAYIRPDFSNRRLPPPKEALHGSGHMLLQTDLGEVDVSCELDPGVGYDELIADTDTLESAGRVVFVVSLERLIALKATAGRAKDRLVLPVLIATLQERERAGR